MVRAWYMDNEETDQRLEHQRNPPEFLDVDELFERTGVEYFQVIIIRSGKSFLNSIRLFFFVTQLNAETYSTDGKIDNIRKDRGYSYEDEVSIFLAVAITFCWR